MARKSTKASLPLPQAPVEISASDRDALIGAYKAGLIMAWSGTPSAGTA